MDLSYLMQKADKDEVKQAIKMLTKRLNELNNNPKEKYILTRIEDKGRLQLPLIDEV